MGFDGMREGRRAENRGVPPVSTLLESADRRARTQTLRQRNRHESPVFDTSNATEEEMWAEIERQNAESDRLNAQAERLSAEAERVAAINRIVESELAAVEGTLERPSDWETWTSIQQAAWVDSRRNMVTRLEQHRDTLRASERQDSREGSTYRRSTLPSPPSDESGDPESLFLPDTSTARRSTRRSHPLSNSWRPESPVGGLGDRIRSPTPGAGDGWEIMRSTITPDASLPSADSSFASAAAAQSFTSNSTSATEANSSFSSVNSRQTSRGGRRAESVSSVDPDDLCDDEDREADAEFAAAMYARELTSGEGLERVRTHRSRYRAEGRRYADADEPEPVELGFRIISEALSTIEGRDRVGQLATTMHEAPAHIVQAVHQRSTNSGRHYSRDHYDDARPPTPHPERYSESAHAAVREASDQVHDYFRRFTADSLTSYSNGRAQNRSPPPRYEPSASHPEANASTSQDGPTAHPVSPPSARVQQDVADALLSGNEHDLDALRDIVGRLAQDEDISDDWWMSMGLHNLSRTRARSRSPARRRERSSEGLRSRSRARDGRVERGDARL